MLYSYCAECLLDCNEHNIFCLITAIVNIEYLSRSTTLKEYLIGINVKIEYGIKEIQVKMNR